MTKFKYEKVTKIQLGEYGELVYVWRGDNPKELLEFSISLRILHNSHWYTIRRHCWTLHQDKFHTHVRVALGKKRFKKVYPPKLRGGIVRALNWAKNDVINNWYIYFRSFMKLTKKV